MIEIRYYGGEMLIDPQRYLDSRNATIGKFRKIIKMSSESDLIYGTEAIESWITAVKTEIVGVNNLLQHICKLKAENKFIGTSADLKRLEGRKRKFEKFKGILSSYCIACGDQGG